MEEKEKNYKKITLLSDTISIPVTENGESLVELNKEIFKVEYKKKDMIPLFGDKIFLRKQLAERLELVQRELEIIDRNLQLYVFYGYRSPEIQEKYYNSSLEIVKKNNLNLSEAEYVELAHSMSAHIKSAGHTVGGAVDLTIWNKLTGAELDMGSGASVFGDIAYTYYPNLTKEQKKNRYLLHEIMIKQGFAPFLGEWWHFSYGDKEWAFFYKKTAALYDRVDPKEFKLT